MSRESSIRETGPGSTCNSPVALSVAEDAGMSLSCLIRKVETNKANRTRPLDKDG